jgi:hypothetical protein
MSTRDPYKLGKTYRSTSEAFKDADYATSIWRCETENQRGWRMIKACAGIASGIGLVYWFAIALVDWLKGFPNG